MQVIKLRISSLNISLASNCVTDLLFNMIRLRYALQVKKIQWRFASGRQGVDCRLRAGQWIFVELFEYERSRILTKHLVPARYLRPEHYDVQANHYCVVLNESMPHRI